MALYNSNNVPLIPGAYVTNMGSGSQYYLLVLPIFSSIADLNNFGWNNIDDTYWIMPGYKVECYDANNYNTLTATFDNSGGTKVMYKPIAPNENTTRSIKLYYNNIEITEKYTYVTIGTTTNSVPSVTNNQLTGAYMLKSMPFLPGAYMVGNNLGCMPIFWSIPDFGKNSSPVEYCNASDLDKYAIVMPGYCLEVFQNTDYGGNKAIIDNTTGTSIIVADSTGWGSQTRSSCKLYYNYIYVDKTNVVSY